MKGIILAGGSGTRLLPFTSYINKHLLPIYNKPMIYYPVNTLIKFNVNSISIVCNNKDIEVFKKYLYKEFTNLQFDFIIQENPLGIVDGIRTATKNINEDILVILGDNVFFGNFNNDFISNFSLNINNYSSIFTKSEVNYSSFGVLERSNNSYKIIEKPTHSNSNEIVVGLYFIKKEHFLYLNDIHLSCRGEYEITDFNNLLIEKQLIKIYQLPKNMEWIDAGNIENLYLSSEKVRNSICE